jgi:hypothetical protein
MLNLELQQEPIIILELMKLEIESALSTRISNSHYKNHICVLEKSQQMNYSWRASTLKTLTVMTS